MWIILLLHLSTYMHFIKKRLQTLFKDQLDRSKATFPLIYNNRKVYGNLPPLSETVMQRRLQFAGHCLRTDDHRIWSSGILLADIQTAAEGKMSYPDTITRDTNLNPNETQQLMRDKASMLLLLFRSRTKDDDDDSNAHF